MANIRTLNVTAVVDLSRLRTGLMSADGLVNQFGARISGHMRGMAAPSIDFGKLAMGAAAFGVAYKAFDGLKDGINNAAHLNEAIAQTKALFGSTATEVTSFGQNFASQFGFAATEVTDIQNRLGGMAKGMGGMGDKEAAEFANTWMAKIADISAFKDISFKEAADAVAIGLRGEQSDVLTTMGIDTRVTNLDTIAARQGMKKPGATWGSSNTLKLATQAIDDKLGTGGVNALGAVQRELSGTTSQMRIAGASATNLGIKVGNALMPAFDSALGVLNRFGGGLSAAFDANVGRISAFANYLSQGFMQVGALVDYLLPSFRAIGITLAGAFMGGGEAISGMIPGFATVGAVAKAALDGINSGLQAFIGFVKDIPAMIDASFGPGAAAMLGSVATAIGATAIAMTTLTGAFTALAGIVAAVAAPLVSVPVLAASAGLGLAYLTGSYTSLADTVDLAGFALQNNTDMFDYWYNSIKDFLRSCVQDFANFGDSLAAFLVNPFDGWKEHEGTWKESDATKDAAERMRANTFDKAKVAPPPSVAVPAAVTAAIAASQAAAADAKAATLQADPKAAAEKKKEEKDAAATLKKFTEDIKTPFEKYAETMAELTAAYKGGDLKAAQFRKAEAFAAKEAGLSTAPKFGAAIEASSKEGYSLMATAMGTRTSFSGANVLEKAADSTAKNTAGILAMQREQLKREAPKPVVLALA